MKWGGVHALGDSRRRGRGSATVSAAGVRELATPAAHSLGSSQGGLHPPAALLTVALLLTDPLARVMFGHTVATDRQSEDARG
jgi:hypothetical protein